MSLPKQHQGPQAWFRKQDANSSTQRVLRKVREIECAHSSFRQRMEQCLGKDKPPAQITTRDELVQHMKILSPQALGTQASRELENAEHVLKVYTQDRTNGSKKVRFQAQQMITDFGNFVGAFSGIVSLIQNAGAPYGGVAYDTLSLLLAVILNKGTNDRKMSDLVRSLTQSFPRLDVLTSIYPSETLEARVVDVYVDVIIFSREAAEYYASFKTRMLDAVRKPPSTGIDLVTNNIKDKLAEVNAEAMIQLHVRNQAIDKNVQELREENRALRNQIAGLETSNARLEASAARQEESIAQLQLHNTTLVNQLQEGAQVDREDRLTQLKSALELPVDPRQWPNVMVDSVRKTLAESFPGSFKDPKLPVYNTKRHNHRFKHMTRGTISAEASFKSFYESQKSSLLFICGRTERDSRVNVQHTTSWLSPAAVFVAEKLQIERGCSAMLNFDGLKSSSPNKLFSNTISDNITPHELCIFYSCHPGIYSSGLWDHDTKHLLGFIIWALCSWHSTPTQLIESARDRISKVMRSKQDNLKESIDSLTTVFIQLLQDMSHFQLTIWIIIDRVDQCDLKLRDLMSHLARMTVCGGPSMKLFVTADASYNGERWEVDDLQRDAREHVIFRDGWDQQRTTVNERALMQIALE